MKPILREACSQEYPKSASCVQRFDDSRRTAIRITYRGSLRSSSLPEPRYPLLRVVRVVISGSHVSVTENKTSVKLKLVKGVNKKGFDYLPMKTSNQGSLDKS